MLFRYFDLDEHGEKVYRRDGHRYVVEPVALIFHEDNYYVMVYSAKHDSTANYRVDRMDSVEMIDEPVSQKAIALIDVFKELSPLVAGSVSDKTKIKRELEKFSDASNDVIPICVIGNYSSGKSTFINALIGYELLPSSDEPTTTKIYKISQTKHPDRATIKFEYDFKGVRIRFSADSYKFLMMQEQKQSSTRLLFFIDFSAMQTG